MHVFPLLELCAAGVLLLNTLGATAENYADYRRSGEMPITAVFAAAQAGVYPWSVLPEQRADIPDEPNAAPQPEVVPPSVSDETIDLIEALEPTSPFVTVDASYFDDALFLGDSHTDGLYCYGGLRNATYCTRNGLILREVFTKSYALSDGRKTTLEELLAAQSFGKLYVMIGINQVNFDTVENFSAHYAEMLTRLRELQPDAVIYVQSILHTTQETSDTTDFRNDTINAFNAALCALCDNEQVFYLDVNPAFDDGNGALRADWSSDGVHVRAAYYTLWRDVLYQHGVGKG